MLGRGMKELVGEGMSTLETFRLEPDFRGSSKTIASLFQAELVGVFPASLFTISEDLISVAIIRRSTDLKGSKIGKRPVGWAGEPLLARHVPVQLANKGFSPFWSLTLSVKYILSLPCQKPT